MVKKIIFGLMGCILLLGIWTPSVLSEGPDQMLDTAGLKDRLKVMTRNIYIGADVDIVLAATDPTEVPVLAAEAFAQMQATNFPERAQALASEIAQHQPHLIGIQEATVIRFQLDGDAVAGGTTPATDVLFNYLSILRATLEAMGLDYKVAAKVQNIDVEVPMFNTNSATGFSDVRVTDHDVILARADVEISGKSKGQYQAQLVVPGAGITVPRGWVSVDAVVNGRSYFFVNTHLEPAPVPELVPLQLAQAQELLAMLMGVTKPVILVGDFNSPALKGETYKFMKRNGLEDAWRHFDDRPQLMYNKRGFTSGHDADLKNETVTLDERIDIIWARSNVYVDGSHYLGKKLRMFIVGNELKDRTPSGLWPSDHAGVIAYLWLPEF